MIPECYASSYSFSAIFIPISSLQSIKTPLQYAQLQMLGINHARHAPSKQAALSTFRANEKAKEADAPNNCIM